MLAAIEEVATLATFMNQSDERSGSVRLRDWLIRRAMASWYVLERLEFNDEVELVAEGLEKLDFSEFGNHVPGMVRHSCEKILNYIAGESRTKPQPASYSEAVRQLTEHIREADFSSNLRSCQAAKSEVRRLAQIVLVSLSRPGLKGRVA